MPTTKVRKKGEKKMPTTEATSNETILCVRVRVFYLIDSDAGALSRLRT
jgi:hypothetical protein